MATTTNFGWETPDDTDLVKDGAAAIRTALGGVDTSFVDLKGGTTGQVLSKASNTDLDYTWVTTDDANAIQNAIVDAKGDLIAATAADTPARLAVGANGEMLVADSTAATGLDWKSATEQYPWTAYTPTTSGFTLGNGTLTSKFQQIGKTYNVEIFLNFGSTTSISSAPNFSLPATAAVANYSAIGVVSLGDFGVSTYPGLAVTPSGSGVYLSLYGTSGTYAQEQANINATVPFTWTTNDYISLRLTYQAA